MRKDEDRQEMRLRPSARLQKYLGRELIGDPNLAILEFVKNAYDAGASKVIVDFQLNADPPELTISDNGTGMDEQAFRINWLRPGFSSKSPDYHGPSTAAKSTREASARAKGRNPAGEKGLGRLASGRLGDVMEVWTRPTPTHEWLHVTFDWASFDDMSKAMDEVPVPFDSEPPEDAAFPAGTIVRVSGLRQTWEGRVPGRPIPGRKRTRLGRLKQDLELLIRPLGGRTSEFSLHLRSDAYLDPSDVGEILASEGAKSSDYTYAFLVGTDEADYVVVRASITRSPEIAKELGLPEQETLPDLTVNRNVARDQNRSEELDCGPFEGTFFYTPPPKARRASQIDDATGVLLYRDGILVEPYGLPGNDWVGVAARKASRQGHAAIQPATFSGYVSISRRNNPALEEMSNRLGLLENDASEDFVSHVRAEFARFEDIVYNELVKKRWTSPEAQARKAAARAETLARVRTRALTHSMGQPMAAIAFEALRLEVVGGRPDVPDAVREQLREIQSRIEAHLNRMGGITQRFADVRVPEFGMHPISKLISAAIAQIEDIARVSDVTIIMRDIADVECLVPDDLVIDSLVELLTNAIEVERPEGRPARITCSSEVEEVAAKVWVVDNGIGFPDGIPEDLESVPPTRGRPPEGLATVDNAIRLANGSVKVESTGPSGTAFLLTLPRRVSRD
jgi:signal transduction histidine kinase